MKIGDRVKLSEKSKNFIFRNKGGRFEEGTVRAIFDVQNCQYNGYLDGNLIGILERTQLRGGESLIYIVHFPEKVALNFGYNLLVSDKEIIITEVGGCLEL